MKNSLLIGLSLLVIGCPWHPDPPIIVDPPPPPYQAAVTLALSFPNPSDPSAINSIRVDVQGSDAAATTQLFVRNTGFTAKTDPIVVTMPVPIFYSYPDDNIRRIFTAHAFSASDGVGTPLFQGSTTGIQPSFLDDYEAPRIAIALSPPPAAAPTITSFDPNTDCGGASLTITGTNFDPIIQNNTVNFIGAGSSSDDRLAFVTEVTPTQLIVTVPRDAANGPMEVTNRLGRVTSTNSFTRSTTPCFGLPQVIVKDNQSGAPMDNREVAVSGSTVIIAWAGYKPYPYSGDPQASLSYLPGIFVIRSTDGGATFGAPVNVSEGISADSPQVIFSGTTVIVGWTAYQDNRMQGNGDIFIARSTDSGTTFEPPVNLSNDRGYSDRPHLVFSGSTVIAAWLNYTPGNTGSSSILMTRSTDGGATFATPISLSTSSNIPGNFDLVLSGSTAIATWIGYSASNMNQSDIFAVRSADGGGIFSSPINVSNKAGLLNHPRISLSGTTTMVTWEEMSLANRGSIMMARSTDSGATFGPPVNLSAGQHDAYFPQPIFSGTTALVAWISRTLSSSFSDHANGDIFVARSADNGATFGAPVKLSNHRGNPYDLQWAVSDTLVMAVWSDEAFGNADIFAASSSNGGATFSRPVNVSNNQGSAFSPNVILMGATGLVLWGDTSYHGGNLWASRFQ